MANAIDRDAAADFDEIQAASVEVQTWLQPELENYVMFMANQQPNGKVGTLFLSGVSTALVAQSVAIFGAASGIPSEKYPDIAKEMLIYLFAAAIEHGRCQCSDCTRCRNS